MDAYDDDDDDGDDEGVFDGTNGVDWVGHSSQMILPT